MAIYGNENITKFAKLNHREFTHLVQNRENICTRNIWHIQYMIWFLLKASQKTQDQPKTQA